MNTNISRRDFLKLAGATLGACTLTGCGLSTAAEPSDETPETETPSFSFGKESMMSNRILVSYATRAGSTVGVAEAVGKTLGEAGLFVDVKPMKDNPVLSGYDAVVLGSAVNGGQWLPEAVEFVKDNQQSLAKVPVALFCVHIMNLDDDDKSRKNRLAYLDTVRSLVDPADEAFFAGVLANTGKTSWLERWAMRTFKVGPEGDNRDWNKINAWAKNLPLVWGEA